MPVDALRALAPDLIAVVEDQMQVLLLELAGGADERSLEVEHVGTYGGTSRYRYEFEGPGVLLVVFFTRDENGEGSLEEVRVRPHAERA